MSLLRIPMFQRWEQSKLPLWAAPSTLSTTLSAEEVREGLGYDKIPSARPPHKDSRDIDPAYQMTLLGSRVAH